MFPNPEEKSLPSEELTTNTGTHTSTTPLSTATRSALQIEVFAKPWYRDLLILWWSISVILGVFSLSIFPVWGNAALNNAGPSADGFAFFIPFYAESIAMEIAVLWMFILLVLPEWEFLSGKVGRGIFTAVFALSSFALVYSFSYIFYNFAPCVGC